MAKKQQKEKSSVNLINEVNSLRKNLLNLRFQRRTGQLEKTSEIKKVRKKIAQTLTTIHQMKDIKNA